MAALFPAYPLLALICLLTRAFTRWIGLSVAPQFRQFRADGRGVNGGAPGRVELGVGLPPVRESAKRAAVGGPIQGAIQVR